MDEARGQLCSRIVQGLEVREIRVPIGEGIVGSEAATGEGGVLAYSRRGGEDSSDSDILLQSVTACAAHAHGVSASAASAEALVGRPS